MSTENITENKSQIVEYLEFTDKCQSGCVFIGLNAGLEIIVGNDIVIIGDDIKNLNQPQKDVVFLNSKVAIGKTLNGKDSDLYNAIIEMIKKSKR